ncbi:MAG: hypothetical protein HYW71_00080 [Candidatus Niyogibacteria bacterium]|nr:hypothetical protein [Candidatus Niyogibacteria bacterium]
MKKLRVAGITCLAALVLFWLICVHYAEVNQLGIRWNFVTGEISADIHKGINVTPPWVLVSLINTHPMRVCVTTSGRGFNCRLIQFQSKYYREFVETEGFRYWWWANRISFNFGYSEEYRGMKDLLRGYSYGVKQYSFVKTLKEYQEE